MSATHTGPRPEAAPAPPPRRVLVATALDEASVIAVLRADGMARAMGADGERSPACRERGRARAALRGQA